MILLTLLLLLTLLIALRGCFTGGTGTFRFGSIRVAGFIPVALVLLFRLFTLLLGAAFNGGFARLLGLFGRGGLFLRDNSVAKSSGASVLRLLLLRSVIVLHFLIGLASCISIAAGCGRIRLLLVL